MPLFEILDKTDLLPFKRLDADSGLYESDVEALLWENLEALTGEPLFRIARQPKIPGGGRPDIVALDQNARVVVIEVKRDVDRMQLAQCLEYAGWARRTNLDELAMLYHAGKDAFFIDWQEYTSTPSPLIVNSSARLVLAARDFQGRTEDALRFLRDSAVPVVLLPIALYQDDTGRRLLDLEADWEPVVAASGAPTSADGPPKVPSGGSKVQIADLLEAGILIEGDELVWARPKLSKSYTAWITDSGGIKLTNGHIYASPSRAAVEAHGSGSYDGWNAWTVTRLDGRLLNDLRAQYLAETIASDTH